MRQLVLIGSPIAHSFSPAIQNAAFQSAGLDFHYEAIEVVPHELSSVIACMRAKSWLGANVTIPYKQSVLAFLDEIHSSAEETGAVNTIVNNDGYLVGHNTDLQGFLRDLRQQRKAQILGRALLLGAGGGARAVAYGLAREVPGLSIIARSITLAEQLARDLRVAYGFHVDAHPWESKSFVEASRQCTLVVNATPLGMMPNDQTSPWPADVPLPPGAFVYDLVYSPADTRLVQQARQAGLQAVSGAGMLLEQAALSYELWAGLPAPRAQMREALEKAAARAQSRDPDEVLDA